MASKQPLPFFQLKVGKSVRLKDIRLLAREMGQSVNATSRFLGSLRVPILAIRGHRVFNEMALETAIFAVTSFGGPGLAAPASLEARHGRRSKLPRKIASTFPHGPQAKAALAAQKQATTAHTDAVKAAVQSLAGKGST